MTSFRPVIIFHRLPGSSNSYIMSGWVINKWFRLEIIIWLHAELIHDSRILMDHVFNWIILKSTRSESSPSLAPVSSCRVNLPNLWYGALEHAPRAHRIEMRQAKVPPHMAGDWIKLNKLESATFKKSKKFLKGNYWNATGNGQTNKWIKMV